MLLHRLCQYQRQLIAIMLLRWKAQLAIVILVLLPRLLLLLHSECNELHVVASCWVENEFTLRQITCVCPLSNQICSQPASQFPSSLRLLPDLVIFLARRTLRIRNIFFVQVIHSCRPGYSSSSSLLLRAVDPWQRAEIKFDSKLTVWGWHTANLLANLICRRRRCGK